MLDLFTGIWGEAMTDCYLNWTLPSILQDDNIPETREFIHEYAIYASEEAEKTIKGNGKYHQLRELIKIRWNPLISGKWELNSNLKNQLSLSCAEKHYLKVISPDTVIGNGSLYNIALLTDENHNPILYGSLRVNEIGWETLGELFEQNGKISNRQLVTIGTKYIEQVGYPFAHKGDHFLVSHNCPTPCLLPDEWLLKFFASNPSNNGGFDHTIPYLMVENGYHWYFIKHSDVYFQVERGRHLLNEVIGGDVSWLPKKHAEGCRFFGKSQQVWKGEPLHG